MYQLKRIQPILILFLVTGINVSCAEKKEEPRGTRMMDTVWNLIEIEGEPVTLGMEARYLDLVLAGNGPRIGGFAGCNRFTGSYEIINDHLALGRLELTYRSCSRAMEQEQLYFEAMKATRRFKHDGDDLTFFNSDGKIILTFEAMHFRI